MNVLAPGIDAKPLCYNQRSTIIMTFMIPAVTTKMQPRRNFAIFGTALLALFLAGCGGGSNQQQNQTTGLKKRVLVSNQLTGVVTIIDALLDKQASAIGVPSADKMVTGNGITVVNQNGLASISVINNAAEQVAQSPLLAARAEDIAITPDGKTVFAAVHNAGTVDFITSDGTITPVNVPGVNRLVLSPNGTKLLAFTDAPTNSFVAIDVATRATTTITDAVNLDQPVNGVFIGNDTQAFIMNCGAECGGTAASVTPVNLTAVTPVGTAIPVSGATVGLLSGSSLFVAGTPVGSNRGTLQTVNTSTLAVSAPITIPDGRHLKMRLTSNNRLYVGSLACTTIPDPAHSLVHGCLAIVDTSSGSVIVPEVSNLRPNFDVTGMLPITNRNVIYVIEGGELDIYDINASALTANQIDIVGKAIDVVQIDP